ncbi:hypothetical protein ACFSX9_14075 [Flavobacterium ardleyense]|uniref:Uncharacterized protein n=1 Tax=Flavobacterium ardleyense TaxID=2038737 RepID=A0ABW5ZAT1_9FLAO
MKKSIVIFMLFADICLVNGQIKKIYCGTLDSIVIKTYSFHDKETSAINDTTDQSIKLIGSKKIISKEMEFLKIKFKKKKSYKKQRALLSYFNIKIFYYHKNQIIQEMVLSTLTKNITIFRNEIRVFKGQYTPYIEDDITKLIN